MGPDGAAHLQEDRRLSLLGRPDEGCCLSMAGLKGICVSGVVTRMIGALRQSTALSATMAEISAAAPQVV